MSVRVGFAHSDITPPAGLPMGGYAARSGVAQGALDRLACRVVTFGAKAPVVCVVLDLLYVARPWADEARLRIARALGTEVERVLLAATHTHAGPAVFRSAPDDRGALAAYEQELAGIVAATAVAAYSTAAAADLFAGAAEVAGVGSSRRDPADPVDARVRVLAARRPDGSLAAALAAFGCHPTVLPPENLSYSRDLFGAAVDAAELSLGGAVLLFNGAAADVSTRFSRVAQTAGEVARLGSEVAAGIVAASVAATPLAGDAIAAHRRVVPVRLGPGMGEAEAMTSAAAAAAAVDRARADGGASSLRLAQSRLEGAMAQVWLARHGGAAVLLGRVPESAEVQCLDICGARVLAVPGEVFSGITRSLDGGTFVVGYANDYLGYLVSPAHAGDGEYESLMAVLAPESAAAIETAVAEMAHG